MSEFPLPVPPGGGPPPRQSAGRLRTIVAMMLREMTSRYGNSPGGYVWAVLEPLGIIVILAFGFSLLLRAPSLGSSFILFYATGYLPYILFLKLSTVTANGLSYSRALLTYPAVSWIDAITARMVLNLLTDVLVAYVLLAGIILALDLRVVLDFVPMIEAFGLAALLGVGIGMVNCVVFAFFPVWNTIWGVLTRPLFLASGVILIYEDLPNGAQALLWWNPLMHITGIMRTGFYSTYSPQYVSHMFVILVALISVTLGLMLLRRHHRNVQER